MNFVTFLLHFELHFLGLVIQALKLEVDSVILRLELPVFVLELLKVFGVLHELFILLHLYAVSLPSHFV